MSRILDTLPGLSMSVRELTRAVESIWDAGDGPGATPMAEFRASQMNLVIHFGAETPVAEAEACFDRALAFARVYPCRIIVLEEMADRSDGKETALGGKLFSQCYLGRDLRDLCCCEALMLSYPKKLGALVEHQVSLWIEADLPVYLWLHRVHEEVVEKAFGAILKQARRVIVDRSVDGARYAGMCDRTGGKLRDLAFARTLRVRQTLGQLLSSVPPADLVASLGSVEVRYIERFTGDAAFLLDWVREALRSCAREAGVPADFHFEMGMLEGLDANAMKMSWRFTRQSQFLNWEYSERARLSHLDADFGHGRMRQPIRIEPLEDAMLLAEAMFFG